MKLEQLGAERDSRLVPVAPMQPWAPGDIPHGETVDLNEYPVALLKMKQCRSFRADLRHKLTLIIRAHGGFGHNGVTRTSKALRVTRQTVRKWIKWEACPASKFFFERIDRLYTESLELLVAAKLKRQKKDRRKKKRNEKLFGEPALGS